MNYKGIPPINSIGKESPKLLMNKKRNDVLYTLNNKGVKPKDSTLAKYNIKKVMMGFMCECSSNISY